jgi:exopolysaccharide production protein ExoY
VGASRIVLSLIGDIQRRSAERRRFELPTPRLGESTEEAMPKFSARTATLQPKRMSGGRLLRQETAAERVPKQRGPLSRHNFRVIEQLDASALSQIGQESHRVVSDRHIGDILKRVLDVLGATLLGVLFLPLILAVAVLLRREGGPIIFRHRRVGCNGQAFDCLKFRSMVPNADKVLRDLLEQHPKLRAEWLRDHKLRDDPRITAVGRFLRRTSLDELPQLWNVIRGEMSLVGPRPVVREELLRYGRHLHRYLAARPGITGLWQVTGRNDTDYRRRVVLDVYYVRRQSVFLDLYILLKTTQVVLGGSGAY